MSGLQASTACERANPIAALAGCENCGLELGPKPGSGEQITLHSRFDGGSFHAVTRDSASNAPFGLTPESTAMKMIAAATVIVLSLATFSTSLASTNETRRSKVVRFTDLDLSHLEGAASLYSRLQGAARAVCGTPLSQRSVSDRLVYETCVDNSVRAATAELDQDLLTEYVASRRR